MTVFYLKLKIEFFSRPEVTEEGADEKNLLQTSVSSSSSETSPAKKFKLFTPYDLTPNDSCGSRTDPSDPSDRSSDSEFDDLDIVGDCDSDSNE